MDSLIEYKIKYKGHSKRSRPNREIVLGLSNYHNFSQIGSFTRSTVKSQTDTLNSSIACNRVKYTSFAVLRKMDKVEYRAVIKKNTFF